jgi:hypothetical protein
MEPVVRRTITKLMNLSKLNARGDMMKISIFADWDDALVILKPASGWGA